jgi:hypothetical protein
MSQFDLSDLPADRPAASFVVRKLPWMADAQCKASDAKLFFDQVEDTHATIREPAIERAQDICAVCPVRKECGAYVMETEGGADEAMRFGFWAYMTPQQRVSIHRRGGLLGRDPMHMVKGRDGERQVMPVPIEGDRWSRHHTTLARRVVTLIQDTLVDGEALPSTDALAELLECHPSPLRRVLDALVQDGTLDMVGTQRRRMYTVRGAARATPSTWLPLHLRST